MADRQHASEPALEPLELTIVYDERRDGVVTARVAEFPFANASGGTRDEARDGVLTVLRELAVRQMHRPPPATPGTQAESVLISVAQIEEAGEDFWIRR